MSLFSLNVQTQSSDTTPVWAERKITIIIWRISMKSLPQDQYKISLFQVPTSMYFYWYWWIINNRFIFRWLVYTLYFSYIIIVPFCYIKIFRYRKNLTIPGSGQTQKEMTKFRKSRNIVTFSYNITIWILETLSSSILVQTVQGVSKKRMGHVGT